MAASGDKPFPTTAGQSPSLPIDTAPPGSPLPGSSSNPGGAGIARENEAATQSATSAMAPNAARNAPPGAAAAGARPGSDMLGGVVQGAHDTIDRIAQSVEPAVRKLQDGIGARSEHMRELGDEWAESLRCTVREHPLASVATAWALGVLFARLTQR